MSGIYIHVPFCEALCHYCNFYFTMAKGNREQMVHAIISELEKREDFLPQGSVKTLYIGGGTPSVYSPQTLGLFVSKVQELWGVDSFEEFTVEVNPEDLSPDYLQGLRKIGCNRLSIGIQSFDDEILKFMNRRHSSKKALQAVNMARKEGFDNISIDLIYGVPNQSVETLENDLKIALSLNCEHISAYHLTIEKGSVFASMERRGKLNPVEESVSELHYKIVSETLRGGGYSHYEVSNFAKIGREAIHNGNYWKLHPYLGVGPSAHSFNGVDCRFWNVASNQKYIRAIENGEVFSESENLTLQDCFNEYIMVSLRTKRGASLSHILTKFGEFYSKKVLENIQTYILSNDIDFNGDNFAIKEESFLKSDFIISGLFE